MRLPSNRLAIVQTLPSNVLIETYGLLDCLHPPSEGLFDDHYLLFNLLVLKERQREVRVLVWPCNVAIHVLSSSVYYLLFTLALCKLSEETVSHTLIALSMECERESLYRLTVSLQCVNTLYCIFIIVLVSILLYLNTILWLSEYHTE
jgi:hypothetical protein